MDRSLRPPPAAMTCSSLSPPGDSGTLAAAAAAVGTWSGLDRLLMRFSMEAPSNPMELTCSDPLRRTVTALAALFLTITRVCGPSAFSASRVSIACCTSAGNRPATGTRPAYGTLMASSAPTCWSGMIASAAAGSCRSRLDRGWLSRRIASIRPLLFLRLSCLRRLSGAPELVGWPLRLARKRLDSRSPAGRSSDCRCLAEQPACGALPNQYGDRVADRDFYISRLLVLFKVKCKAVFRLRNQGLDHSVIDLDHVEKHLACRLPLLENIAGRWSGSRDPRAAADGNADQTGNEH